MILAQTHRTEQALFGLRAGLNELEGLVSMALFCAAQAGVDLYFSHLIQLDYYLLVEGK